MAMRWFLQNDPTYRDPFLYVWMWNEWPDREQKCFGQDIGIDLIAQTFEGAASVYLPLNCILEICVFGREFKSEFLVRVIARASLKLLCTTSRLVAALPVPIPKRPAEM